MRIRRFGRPDAHPLRSMRSINQPYRVRILPYTDCSHQPLTYYERSFNMLTRRQAIKSAAIITAAYSTVASTSAVGSLGPLNPAPGDAFTLPALPYAFDALEPHIDA